MRFGLFYEHQHPRPWDADAHERLLREALEQIEIADRAGFDYVWEVEHHFLEEYSHSSAPEVFLAAASQRTERIRLGHGIVQLPPAINHPARIAERIATLDLVSGGRVEFGTGEGSSQAELGAFGVDRNDKRAMWEEALDAIARMFVEEPFAGVQGSWVSMPPRNVMPKPKQRPHPPLWVACSRRDTILLAARKGLGALSFSFVEPEEAKEWVDDYYGLIASEECVPAGFAVNPNFAVTLPMMCHEDEQTAIDRGVDGGHFFGYSLAHYYIFGEHRPGQTVVWDEFRQNRDDRGFAKGLVRADDAPLGVKLLQEGMGSMRGAIGTPDQIAELVERYERVGVDQMIFVLQAGKNKHEHICEALELFGEKVLPRFAERAEQLESDKRERLAEACERALARRAPARSAPDYVISPMSEPAPADLIAAARRNGGEGDDGDRSLPERLRALGETAFASFVSGRSDEQLDRIVGSDAGLKVIFKGMERAFIPEKAKGFEGDIQWELDSQRGPRRWFVRIHPDRAEAHEGSAPDPKVVYRMSVPLFARIIAQDVHPAKALLDEELVVEGDPKVILRMDAWFGAERPF